MNSTLVRGGPVTRDVWTQEIAKLAIGLPGNVRVSLLGFASRVEYYLGCESTPDVEFREDYATSLGYDLG